MNIADLFKKEHTVFSFEVFPPKKESGIETIYSTLNELKNLNPDFISVTYGAGGKGVANYDQVDYMIAKLIYVQCVFGIEQRKGRRMYHEVFSLDPHEFIRMGRNVNALWKFADQCAQCYFDAGYQVVYAIHGTNESDLHIHFAVSAINFRSGLKWHDSKTDLDMRAALFNKILGKYQYMFIVNK